MYLSLIDTVSTIVKTYGVDILSEHRFWHILSDSYSFKNEYTLKHIFKNCIKTGYISKIVKLKGNAKSIKAEIAHIIDTECRLNPDHEKEYTAILYSVAIATGSCSKQDYSDFINRSDPQLSTNHKNNNKSAVTFELVLSIIIGLIILFSSTIFYGVYLYDRWWMFFVILLIGFVQLAFCSFCLNKSYNSNLKWSSAIKRTAASCHIPIIFGFFINSLVPLFLRNESIRTRIYYYFSTDFHPDPISTNGNKCIEFSRNVTEAPGTFSIVLAVFVAYCLFSCCLGLYSEKYSFSHPRFRLSKRAIVIVSSICILGYSFFFASPPFKHANQEEAHNEWNINNQQNLELMETRKNTTPELSFKGIKLGHSFETAQEYTKALNNFESNEYLYYSLRPTSTKALTNINLALKPEIKTDSTWLTGKLIASKSKLVDTSVNIRILERDNIVSAIIILPQKPSNWHYINGFFENYKDLAVLYLKKYGKPERTYIPPHSSDNQTANDGAVSEYVWTFGNGTIRMSTEYIIYSTKSFDSDVNRVNRIIERMEKAEELGRIYQQNKIDSTKRAKAIADSLNRIINLENAVNEI